MHEIKDLVRAFDRRGCTGLTIWVNSDGHIQVNMRSPDGISWGCNTNADFVKALNMALDEFLGHHTKIIERSPKLPRQMKAEKEVFNLERRKRKRGR